MCMAVVLYIDLYIGRQKQRLTDLFWLINVTVSIWKGLKYYETLCNFTSKELRNEEFEYF